MQPMEVERIESGFLFEAARSAPPDAFPCLPDIPGGRYVNPAFHALERDGMWRRSWLYAIHGDEVPETGSYVRWDRAGEPLFFVRGADGVVRCFYNTCRHRGAPVVTAEYGRARGMTCGYHGWTYDLTGRLVGLRDRRDFVGLDMSCRSLIEVRCEALGRWHFINLDPGAKPLLDEMGPVADGLAEFAPDTLRLVDKASIALDCNVKVLLDAFLEVYHLKSIHKDTVDRFLDHRAAHITLWPNGHSRMTTPNRRPEWTDPGVAGLPTIPTADPFAGITNISYNLFPNLVAPVSPAGLPFLCFWPTGLDTMVIEVHWFGLPWEGERPAVWDARIRNFHRILEEDTQFAGAIQRSVSSAGFRGMPLNYQERRIYHWHQELDRRIGPERVPAELVVTPVLGQPFVEQAAPSVRAA